MLDLLLYLAAHGLIVLQGLPQLGGALVSSGPALQNLGLGAGCEPDWIPTFGGVPGVDGGVRDFALFDDGSGAGVALYVAGYFDVAGGVPAKGIAKWDGSAWSPLGSGLELDLGYAATAYSLAVFDDGSGSALYVGGHFSSAGGIPAANFARWDGAGWSAPGGGTNAAIRELLVHDDGGGSGLALFAGGEFTGAGGVGMNRIARWDGTSWSALGTGANGTVTSLVTHDDGSGPKLFVGGEFTQTGTAASNRIAAWDGTSWSALGSGMDHWVQALTVHDEGSGPRLVAGGSFSSAGGVPAARIARWDGAAWSGIGGGMSASWPQSGAVFALTVHDDGAGGGAMLFAGGGFDTAGGAPALGIARWDGAQWSSVGGGVRNGGVQAFGVYDHPSGSGAALFVGGGFLEVDEVGAWCIACWDGVSWATLPGGLSNRVDAVAVYDDGGGDALFAGGWFRGAGGSKAHGIARWDGTSWAPLGPELEHDTEAKVGAFAVFDDGNGRGLYVGGKFTSADGVPMKNIAKWDGVSFSPVGAGLSSMVAALAVHDDGGGPMLYAGGTFGIQRWNGSTWSVPGTPPGPQVDALAVADLGPGPRLYAAGNFSHLGPDIQAAQWDGSTWSSLGGPIQGWVNALLAFDDGSGPAVYFGGTFQAIGGIAARSIAKWDGVEWSALRDGLRQYVNALTAYDDGGGPRLYAGGSGQIPADLGLLAHWDGESWRHIAGVSMIIYSLGTYDDGSGIGPTLVVGGAFSHTPGGDAFLARWGGCAPIGPGSAFCFGDGSGTSCPCGNGGGPGEGCATSLGVGARLEAHGSNSTAADDLVLAAGGLVPDQVALLVGARNVLGGGDGLPFGDGLRCVGGDAQRMGIRVADPLGAATWGPGLVGHALFLPGSTHRFQVWLRDPSGPCNQDFNFSNGYALTFIH